LLDWHLVEGIRVSQCPYKPSSLVGQRVPSI